MHPHHIILHLAAKGTISICFLSGGQHQQQQWQLAPDVVGGDQGVVVDVAGVSVFFVVLGRGDEVLYDCAPASSGPFSTIKTTTIRVIMLPTKTTS